MMPLWGVRCGSPVDSWNRGGIVTRIAYIGDTLLRGDLVLLRHSSHTRGVYGVSVPREGLAFSSSEHFSVRPMRCDGTGLIKVRSGFG